MKIFLPLIDWIFEAGITPASGFIQTYFAGIVGFFCAVAAWYGIILFKKKMKYDDALDVSSVCCYHYNSSFFDFRLSVNQKVVYLFDKIDCIIS